VYIRNWFLFLTGGGLLVSDRTEEPKVSPWFAEYYSSEMENLRRCMRDKKCFICGFSSRNNQIMGRHYAVHLPKNIPCQYCSVRMSNDCTLSTHVRRKHDTRNEAK
jgi:hypothetical protein